jgi:two-component system chemotaxis response regulator CheY
MLKAVLVDASALSRGLLATVLTEGGYNVVAQTHTAPHAYALVQKFHPHVFCIALEQIEDGNNVVEQIRQHYPKTLVFMVSGAIDASIVQKALERGVNGFIVKPFNAGAVLKTIRNTVLAMIRKQQEQA